MGDNMSLEIFGDGTVKKNGNTALSINNTPQVSFENSVSQPGGFSFRNKIINGNFDIWQRGTSQTSAGYGSSDRWLCYHTGSTKTASRQAFTLGQTDVPGEPAFFMRHVVTSVSGAGNFTILAQKVESVRSMSGKTVTVSFWAKADANKSIAADFQQNFGTGGSPSNSVVGIGANKFSLSTSWNKYTLTTTIPSISGKIIGSDNNDFLEFVIWFEAGSNFNARADSLGQQSGTFDIAQVQLEEGSVATPFEQRPIGLELSLCQRYYESGGFFHVQSNVANATNIGTTVWFKQKKRASPTITQTNTSAVNVGTTTQNAALPEPITQTADTTVGFLSFRTTTSSALVSQYTEIWTASAEL